MFRGYDKAGTYTEVYELNHIQPIISKELYEKCVAIRDSRNKLKSSPPGVAQFPALFKCSCGRNLRRDDKKNNRYLRCSNHINDLHLVKCGEKYTNLKVIEPQIEQFLRDLIPHKELRTEMIAYIEKEMKIKATDKNRKLTKRLTQSCELQEQLEEVTDKFVEGIIDNKEYKLLANSLKKKAETVDVEIEALQDFSKYAEAGRKIIKFLQILETYEQHLDLSDSNKKSSKLFGVLFHVVSNLTVTDKKASNYKLFQPFDILQKRKKSEWWTDCEPFRTSISIHR